MVEKLIEELNTADIVLQEYLTERESTGSSEYKKTGPTDIMKNFPLLQAVMHESNRRVRRCVVSGISNGNLEICRQRHFAI